MMKNGVKADHFTGSEQAFWKAVISLRLQGRTITKLDLIQQANSSIPADYWEKEIRQIWDNPPALDANGFLPALKEALTCRRATKVIAQTQKLLNEKPHDINKWLPQALTALQNVLADSGTYSPDPKQIYLNSTLPTPFAGTGFEVLDELLLGGYRYGDLILWYGLTKRGKCLSGASEIYDADTGEWRRIDDVFHNGLRPSVVSTNSNGEIRTQDHVVGAVSNGLQETFRVITESGDCIEGTSSHRLLTDTGYKTIAEIKPGMRLAKPAFIPEPRLPVEQEVSLIKFLAYLITEGALSNGNLRFTNGDKDILESFESCVVELGYQIGQKYYGNGAWTVSVISAEKKPREYLKSIGLLGKKSGEKFIPDFIFRLPNEQLRIFLGCLWAGDGSFYAEKKSQVRAEYASKSRRMSYQIKRLMLRLGIQSTMSEKKVNGESYWRIRIDETESLSVLLRLPIEGEMGRRADVFGKALGNFRGRASKFRVVSKEWWSKISAACKGIPISRWPVFNKKRDIALSDLRSFVSMSKNEDLDFSRELVWDRVSGVKNIGEQETFDIQVSTTHNFLVNGIISHNSTAVYSLTAKAVMAGLPCAFIKGERPIAEITFQLLKAICGDIVTQELLADKEFTAENPKYTDDVRAVAKDAALQALSDNLTIHPLESRTTEEIQQIVAIYKPVIVFIDPFENLKVGGWGGGDEWKKQQMVAQELLNIASGQKNPCAIVGTLQLSPQHEKEWKQNHAISTLRGYGTNAFTMKATAAFVVDKHWAQPNMTYGVMMFRTRKDGEVRLPFLLPFSPRRECFLSREDMGWPE